MAHTPGPWTVHPTGAQVVGGPDGMTSVANVFGTHWEHSAERMSNAIVKRDFQATAQEHHANARLIAAAPELLAALKRFEKLTRCWSDVGAQEQWAAACEAIQWEAAELIARAELVVILNGYPVPMPSGAVAYKYADPTENARWLYDETEAEEIARIDPGLIVRPEQTTEG